MSEEIINSIIEMLQAQDDYKTIIIGVLAGRKEEVLETEREFDQATDDLLSKNGFIKLSDFKGFKKSGEQDECSKK